MKKGFRIGISIISFLILGLLIYGGHLAMEKKIREFNLKEQEVAGFAETTINRINKAVLTLPENDTLVGLKEGIGSYQYYGSAASARIDEDSITTNFIPGIYQARDARTDALSVLRLSDDSYGGSTYVILWNDRGDAALEKSYARVGGNGTKVASITTHATDGTVGGEEYRVDIEYINKSALESKHLIIPVVDGHFKP